MSWKAACTVTDVKAQKFDLFNVDGIPILIANIDGEWRAYPPVCPHMEEPLIESGLCRNGVMTCTKHLWQWDMLTGEAQGPAERPMLMYDVRLEGDQVMVLVETELDYDDNEDDDDDY